MSFPHFFRKSPLHHKRGRQTKPARAPLFLEHLEHRITPDVTLNNGHLLVNGDSVGGNIIFVDVNGIGGVLVELNHKDFSFSPGEVSSIEVNAGGGNDYVEVDGTLFGVPLSISSTGVDGDWILLGGDLFATTGINGNLGLLKGPIAINGNGRDMVYVGDELNPFDDAYTITDTFVGRVGFGGLTYSGLATLSLSGGSGGSSYTVESTEVGTRYYLNSGAGKDTFNVGTGNLDTIQGPVFVANHGGSSDHSDAVILDDEANPFGHTYRNETNDELGRIYLNLVRDGELKCAVYQDRITATINAGAGDDIFDVRTTTENGFPILFSPLTFHAGAGSNVLSLDDRNSTLAGSYEVTSTEVDASGVPFISYSEMSAVTVSGTNNASTFFIPSVINGCSIILNTGRGVNKVIVGDVFDGLNAIRGPVSVFGVPVGFTSVTLDDVPSSSARDFVIQNSRVLTNLGTVNYSGIDKLILDTGRGDNSITILGTPADLAVTINAGTGSDDVRAGGSLIGDVSAILGPLTVNGGNHTTLAVLDQSTSTPQAYTLTDTTVTRSGEFTATYANLHSLAVQGGSGENHFVVTGAPANMLVTLNGGDGSNTLSGPDGGPHVTTFAITGPGSGRIGKDISFTGMHDLVGSNGFDAFRFFPGGDIAGTISGGGGDDELDYSALDEPITINLQTFAAPHINGGGAGGFSSIRGLVGGMSLADTLIGPDSDTGWIISGANFGRVEPSDHIFGSFENLVGGAGVDVFNFTASGSLAGGLDGGGAPLHKGNWLAYEPIMSATVNLHIGGATGVAGGAAGVVTNIQNVHGGNGGNTLIGDDQGNILIGGTGVDIIIGGTGPSILIGDLGADNVTARSGGDILIGDATNFDGLFASDENALMAILAEWQSADSYATRFHDINTGTGGGLNGTSKLQFGTTVKDDGAADTVTGADSAVAFNWFFQGAADILFNVKDGEHINNK
jgi:hypothetical protein